MRPSFWLAGCAALLALSTSTPAHASPGAVDGVAPATDMQLTPLGKDDIALYLQVMRAAAARIDHPTAGDKAVLAQANAVTAANQAGRKPSFADVRAMQDGDRLKTMDVMIVQERHIDLKRYVGIASVIEDIVQTPPGTGHGTVTIGRGAPSDASAAAASVREQIKAVEAKDAPMLAPHRAEIRQLMAVVRKPRSPSH